jgi:hypothetical protein
MRSLQEIAFPWRILIQPLRPIFRDVASASTTAKKLGPEGGGDFNPRIKPAESMGFSLGGTLIGDILPESGLFPQPLQALSSAR